MARRGLVSRGRARAYWTAVVLLAALVGLWPAKVVAAQPKAGTDAAASTDPTALQRGRLHSAIWRAEAFGRAVGGGACWLSGPDGALRIEAASDGVAGGRDHWLPLLLLRSGDGWTFTHSGMGGGTLNRWGAEWRPAPGELTPVLLTVVATLEDGPGAELREGRQRPTNSANARPVGGRRWRPLLRQGKKATGEWKVAVAGVDTSAAGMVHAAFRSEQIARGHGRGGRGEVLRLSWRAETEAAAGWSLEVRSTRRFGRLTIQPLGAQVVRYPLLETFVPLWPLVDLLALPPG